jgi:DNA-directed RNA polymerase specialized sigma24 family protein
MFLKSLGKTLHSFRRACRRKCKAWLRKRRLVAASGFPLGSVSSAELETAVMELPRSARTAIALHLRGWDYCGIALELGVPEQVARHLVIEALAELDERLSIHEK